MHVKYILNRSISFMYTGYFVYELKGILLQLMHHYNGYEMPKTTNNVSLFQKFDQVKRKLIYPFMSFTKTN